ncbi:MAG: putative 2OG-Fe(II) oxygenase [Cyanobacteriota bacterium]
MELLSLFPRTILKGHLEPQLLQQLQSTARSVRAAPQTTADASGRLAGQLTLQRQLGAGFPGIDALCGGILLPACERWIRHVIDQQPPQGRGPWTPGRYGLQMIDIWLNVQQAGDYNPTHTHGGSFSGVIFLQVPPQIRADSFDGQLCFHGPEDWQIQSFRTGMAHYVLPVPGDYWVFPAWQPHSVTPFRGAGERWSLAFNVQAVPGPPAAADPGPTRNISLSSSRPRPGGF